MLWEWKGLWDYGAAWEAQRAYRRQRQAGEVPDMLWLLEHPPVITSGRRAVEGLGVPPHYAHYVVERGGLATCHEPGQLVGYILMDARRLGPKRLVATLESALIAWLQGQGMAALRREGFPGVWLQPEGGRWTKLGAVGLHLEGGYSMHGFALNLHNSLEGFMSIIPCGIQDASVGRLLDFRPDAPMPEQAAAQLGPLLVGELLDALRGTG